MRFALAALVCTIGVLMNASASVTRHCCPVIELRQYTLKSGQRDLMIELFDRYLVESQEAVGMTVIGQFRDRRRPDRFVWMRGFQDMPGRHRALEQFYGGPVWAAHRTAANDTMLDSDNVLLLKPARAATAFPMDGDRPAADAPRAGAIVLAGIHPLKRPADDSLVSRFEGRIAPRLRAEGVDVKGVFVTETARNTFTRLPVREGEYVLVWVGTVSTNASRERLDEVVRASALDDGGEPPVMLDLEPTSRSWLGRGPHAARAAKHDFDFLHGSWTVHNRYLKARLKQSTEWGEFEAESRVEPLLDGLGQLDRFSTVRDGVEIQGITLRLFNPSTGEWGLHWADTVRPGVLLPPMVGRFNGEIGEFYGDETVDGVKVLCRFYWNRTNADAPRWEQAFSNDGGKTWETNWIMTFRRR